MKFYYSINGHVYGPERFEDVPDVDGVQVAKVGFNEWEAREAVAKQLKRARLACVLETVVDVLAWVGLLGCGGLLLLGVLQSSLYFKVFWPVLILGGLGWFCLLKLAVFLCQRFLR